MHPPVVASNAAASASCPLACQARGTVDTRSAS